MSTPEHLKLHGDLWIQEKPQAVKGNEIVVPRLRVAPHESSVISPFPAGFSIAFAGLAKHGMPVSRLLIERKGLNNLGVSLLGFV